MVTPIRTQLSNYRTSVGLYPEQGPVAMDLSINFATDNVFVKEFYQEESSLKVDFIQSIYIDNSQSLTPVTVSVRNTVYNIEAAPGTQGWYPIDIPAGAAQLVFSRAIAENTTLNVVLFNSPMPYIVWSTLAGAASLIGITANNNVALGQQAGLSAPPAAFTTYIGLAAGEFATAPLNVGVGASALEFDTGVGFNVGVGANALQHNTTGTRNVAVGAAALAANTTSFDCVAIGNQALAAQTANNGGNIAIGSSTLTSLTLGFENACVGHNVAPNATDAQWLCALGVEVLFSNTTGDDNTGVGLSALHDNTTGSHNTGVGGGAGIGAAPNGPNAQRTGSWNTYLGAQTVAASPAQVSNMTLVGAQSSNQLSNSVTLGRLGTDVIYAGETVLGPNSAVTGAGAAARTAATLPAPSAALRGARSFIVDASVAQPVFMAAVAGGGANPAPVFCTGTAWVYG